MSNLKNNAQNRRKDLEATKVSMGDLDRDAGDLPFRKCSNHVYEDVISFYDGTGPSTSQLDETSLPRMNDISCSTPSRLRWPLVNQLLPPTPAPFETIRSCPAPSEKNISPNPVEVKESQIHPPLVDDSKLPGLLALGGSTSSITPEAYESKITCPASIEWSCSCRVQRLEEDTPCNPPEIDDCRGAIPGSMDEGRSCCAAQVEECTSSSPPQSDETGSASPVADDKNRQPHSQAQETKSSSPPQVDDGKTTSLESFDVSPSSDELAETPSSVTEKAEEIKDTSASTSPRGDSRSVHFVKGYVVKDRKPNRHIPALNSKSKYDDGTRPDFDILDEVGEVGHVRDMFWPQPGDILVLQSHRSGIPYPGFDGHVELYVDDDYFENPDYTWDWAYHFQEGDILIRFGRFSPSWKWSPETSVQVYLRFKDCFVLVGREVNHELCPLDFKFSDPTLHPIHSTQVDFLPRLGDLIIRKDSAKPFSWTLSWWKESFYTSHPFDMLIRASFVNSDNQIHSFGMAEVYFRNAQNQQWSFQGRDDYTFGAGL